MKYLRITLLVMGAVNIFNAFALDREITVGTPGSLKGIISDTEREEITSLKVTGPVNGSDMALIRYMAGSREFNEKTPGKLESLDLSGAQIVAEDTPYLTLGDESYNSEDDVLSPYMLYGCGSLKELSLPSTLKEIGDVSLGWCTQLEALEIPSSVVYIGASAFTFCESIKSLRVPDSVTKVGASCFEYMNSLQELHTGNGLRVLPRGALSCDDSLEILYIGKAFRVYENGMIFSDLPNLQSFQVDEGNLKYSSKEGILYSKDMSILCAMPCSKDISEFKIPSTVSEIDEFAFANNKKLEKVTIPGTVRRIGGKAFYYAAGLRTVNMEEGVSEIGDECFSFTNDIKEIHLPASMKNVGGGAFSYSQSLEKISVAEDNPYFKIVGMGLYSKDLRRFFGLPHLYATSLSEFDLHPDCMAVEPHALDGLWNIKSLDLIGRVRYIGSYAAAGCHKLERVVLGPNVSYIGEGAFISHGLKEVECMPYMLEEVDATAFRNGLLAQDGTLYVPQGTSYFYMLQPWVYDEDQHYQVFANVVEKEFSGIDTPSVTDENSGNCTWYSIDGRHLSTPVRGINILVEPNGIKKKVILP